MIIPEKTYSSNPFVDNIIYYAKLMALNCTVKDEEEALANETKESLYAGDLYIACIENRATYEMFQNVPAEILEKYISYSSNLDIYAKNPKNLKVHLNHYQPMVRNGIYKNLSSLARTVYIDHFDIMADYINEVGTQWLADYSLLYNKSRSGIATYEDLFDELPIQTVMRILKAYLNARGYCELVSIWDPQQITAKVLSDLAVEEARLSGNPIPIDSTVVLNVDYLLNESLYDNNISTYFNQFKIYINSRSDSAINTELDRISQAMRDIFIDHYEIMRGRRYFSNDFYFKDATEYPEAYTHVSMTDEEFVELFSSGQIYRDSVISDNAYIYSPGNGVEVDLDLVDPAWMGYYHNKDIYDMKRTLKASITENLQKTSLFDDSFILDFQVAQSGVAKNKKSFLFFQFLLRQRKDRILKMKEIKKEAENTITDIVKSLEDTIYEHDFSIYKNKK